MIYTIALLDALVARLRQIPEWVTAVGGAPERIAAYKPEYPDRNDADKAVYEMPWPGVLVMCMGGGPVADGDQVRHQDNVVIHCKFGPGVDILPTLALFRSHTVPGGVRLEYEQVSPAHYPMNTPAFDFTQDEEGQDVYHITTGFIEAGI